MNMLGNSIQEIAREKAGIFKEGVPVVVGEFTDATKEIFDEVAAQKKVKVVYAPEYFKEIGYTQSPNALQLLYEDEKGKQFEIDSDLTGIYQKKNVRTVLAVLDVLKQSGYDFGSTDLKIALKQVKKLTGLSGRWDVIHQDPTVILEVAHNKDGIEQMVMHLSQMHFNKLHIVFGIVKDKDPEGILNLLPKNAVYYFTKANIPRAMDAADLKNKAAGYALTGKSFQNVNEAINNALDNADHGDLIIVCGSIFLVAEVNRESVLKHSQSLQGIKNSSRM
jgi:dihydrofolate synthase/folylpolyglutamate synthase